MHSAKLHVKIFYAGMSVLHHVIQVALKTVEVVVEGLVVVPYVIITVNLLVKVVVIH